MTRDVLIQVSQPAAASVRRTSCFFKDIAAEWWLPTFPSPSPLGPLTHVQESKREWDDEGCFGRGSQHDAAAAVCHEHLLESCLEVTPPKHQVGSFAHHSNISNWNYMRTEPHNVLSNLAKGSQRRELSSPAAVTLPYTPVFLQSQCVVGHPSIFIQFRVMLSYMRWLCKFSCTAEIKSGMSSYHTVFNLVTCSGGWCECLLKLCFKKKTCPVSQLKLQFGRVSLLWHIFCLFIIHWMKVWCLYLQKVKDWLIVLDKDCSKIGWFAEFKSFPTCWD